MSFAEPLAAWLPRQRWFAGKGRPIATVETTPPLALHEEAGCTVVHCLVTVCYSDAERDVYQVPLTVHQAPQPQLEHALVGEDPGGGYLYDGVHDPTGSAVWPRLLREAGPVGDLRFTLAPGVGVPEEPGQVIGAEQSNSSLVYGERAILKLFRRLAPGVNPDLELTRALQAAGCRHIVAPDGWVSTTLSGVETTLALLTPYYRTATEGWRLATASVRDLYAEADLHAAEVGGDFAGEARRLGAATGEVHRLLRETLPSATAGPDETAATVAAMRDRLVAATRAVPELASHAGAVHQVYDEVATLHQPIPVQRIHGDFHLGQVLRVEGGWLLFDFEGEPARPLAERTTLMSPLRDVAGMLRSFDYAARSLLTGQRGAEGLVYRATEWAERNGAAFCDGYAASTGADPREQPQLLRACVLDKMVYEVLYEARHRPGWLPIPLGALQRLTA